MGDHDLAHETFHEVIENREYLFPQHRSHSANQ